MEPPWKNNQKNESCIPEGDYSAVRFDSPRYGHTLKLINVPDRSDIIFHTGNNANDTDGCILTGSGFADWNKSVAIVDSKTAFAEFQSWLILNQIQDAIISVRNAQCTTLPPECKEKAKL